ncbi:MAG: MoxR family ATPase [Phycisphaerales bacterium]|jgi:MoxR-like ATPase|nr:MoxR family ATPase [Phycisphaerales bacterium]
MNETTESVSKDDVAEIAKWKAACERLRAEMAKVIVGQDEAIEQMLISVLARGHALLEGVPGIAKTLMVHTLADGLNLSFHRIQFTPDMMPSDITGTDVLQEDPVTRERKYEFVRGPIFANIILGDEINRTPPKTQASMLEAMQERMISAGTKDYKLPDPFFVLATQNPLEQEGTYPLPEAQLDRFLLYIKVGYPTGAEEWEIARRVTSGSLPKIEPVLTAEEIVAAQQMVLRMPACDQVVGYSWALVRATRPGTPEAPDFVNKWVNWGAGPRGVLTLIAAAKARALMQGRFHASVEDVQAIIAPALRHRMRPNYAAMAANINSEKLIEMLLEAVPADAVYETPKA